MLHSSPPAAIMAPKSGRGKGVAKDAGEKEPPESELAVRRTQYAYFPLTVDVFELRDCFKPLWGCKTGGETTGHPATRVIPANCAEAAPNRYPFFVDYFSCGLCPPSLISSMTSCTPTASTFWILL
jgi:hypothetical protein